MSATNGISSLQQALGSLNLTEANQAKPAAAGRSAEASSSARTDDRANVSVAGGLAAQGTSDGDVRLEKVAALQQQIAAGTYQVPASAVADKLLESLLGSN